MIYMDMSHYRTVVFRLVLAARIMAFTVASQGRLSICRVLTSHLSMVGCSKFESGLLGPEIFDVACRTLRFLPNDKLGREH